LLCKILCCLCYVLGYFAWGKVHVLSFLSLKRLINLICAAR
jgi:hypothetical protein